MTAYKQILGLIDQSNLQLIVNRLLTLITSLNRRLKKTRASIGFNSVRSRKELNKTINSLRQNNYTFIVLLGLSIT
jgi:hypothetical protein